MGFHVSLGEWNLETRTRISSALWVVEPSKAFFSVGSRTKRIQDNPSLYCGL